MSSATTRSDEWNAYLRRVEGESVSITHPCHPFAGQSVPVLHHRPRGGSPTVVVEMPDGTARPLPLEWTDRARPDPHAAAAAPGGRLSGLALLEVAALLRDFRKGG